MTLMGRLSDEDMVQLRALLADGSKLRAIALYVRATGLSLFDAKHAVDSIEMGLPEDTPRPPAWKPSGPPPPEVMAELESRLPNGWSVARIRDLEPHAELLDPTAHEVLMHHTKADTERLNADLVLYIGGQVLVRELGYPGWLIGGVHPDGSIWCIDVDYGDLGSALRSL